MASRSKMPSQTALKEYLRLCSFNPRDKVGPMHIITDVGNRAYWEGRAVEMIREAQEALLMDNNPKQYHHNMQMAIGLLGLAALHVEIPDSSPQEDLSRPRLRGDVEAIASRGD